MIKLTSERKHVTLRAEDVSHVVGVDGVLGVKEEVEIFDRLGEEEALLAVLETLVVDIVDSCVTTSEVTTCDLSLYSESHSLGFRVVIETLQDVSADV